MGEHVNAVPDYARMAELAVVTMGYPRAKWKAGGIEHRIVDAILVAWAKDREVNNSALCRECQNRPAGPNGGMCGPCTRRLNNDRRREQMRGGRASGEGGVTTAAMRRAILPTEHEEQVRLFQWAELAAGRYPELAEMFAVPNFSGRLGKVPPVAARRQAQALKDEGRKPGIEDVMLLVPRGGYHGLLIEMKRQHYTPSDVKPEQRAWHEVHRARGFCVWVCAGFEDARRVVLNYLSEAA